MNKKFSTLVAGALLATTVGAVSAQDVANYSKSAAPSTLETVTKVTDGRVYQLSDGYKVLVMKKVSDGNGGYRFELGFVPYYEATVGESLWYVKQEKSNNENGIAFQFVNLAYNYPISFDPSKAQNFVASVQLESTNLGGDAVNWSWMRSAEGRDLQIARTPEAYFTSDSVMTMVPLSDGKIAAVKYATKDYAGKLDELRLKPYVAGPVWLNKHDLNSMLQTQEEDKAIFSFAKGATEPNLWDKTPYEAVDAVGKNTLSYGAVADAKAEYEKAEAIWREKDRELEAAIADLEYAKSEVKELSQQKRELRNQLNAKETETIDKSKMARFYADMIATSYESYKIYNESAIQASNITEEQKEALLSANFEFGKANEANRLAYQAYSDAQGNVADAETAKAEAEDTFAGSEEELRTAEYQLETSQTVIDAIKQNSNEKISDFADRTTVAFSKLLTAVRMEGRDFDEELLFQYASIYVDWLKNEGVNVDKKVLEASGLDVATGSYIKFLTDAKTDKATGVALAEQELKDVLAALVEAEKLLSEAEEARDEADKNLTVAYNNVNNIQNGIDLNSELSKHYQELADAQLKAAQDYEAKYEVAFAELETLNDEYLALRDAYKALSLKLRDLKLYTFFAGQAVMKTDMEAAQAARFYQNLYAVYANLNAVKTPYWLSLKAGEDAKGNNLYLMVDTAYLENEVSGNQHLAFATKTHTEDFVNPYAPVAARDVNGRFNFRFLYWPTQDSMRIEADGFNQKNIDVLTQYWADRKDDEITLKASMIPGYEQNLVKIAVLGGGRREATIGNSENLKGTTIYTINDRIGLKLSPAEHAAVLEPGVYFLDVVNGADKQKNGARLMLDLDGWSLTKIAPVEWDVMKFEHMPAAKWIVDKNTTDFGGYPEIWNQEIGSTLNNGAYKVLAKDDNEAVIVINYYYRNEQLYLANDTLKLTKTESNRMGYYNEKTENVNFTLNYLNVNPGLSVTIGNSTVGNDTILRVSADDATKFDLEYVGWTYYNRIHEKDTIFQTEYRIRVNDPYKFANDQKYVQVSQVGGTEMLVVADKANASIFRLKEVNCVDGIHYYALLTDGKKAGVIDATGLIKVENLATESTTSAFALVADTTKLYRELTTEELGENGAIGFYRVNSTEKAYLYEGANSLLCVEGKGDNKAETFTVIPTGVENTLMPQYLIAKDVESVKGDTIWCNATGTHTHATLADSLACPHTVITADTTFGRFLVNMIDSVPAVDKYTWEKKYKRLAFLPGYIANDTLTLEGTTKVVGLSKVNQHDVAKFAFRLVSDESDNFLIESESYGKKTAFDGGIAPSANLGGWVKVQNGVPVIINDFEAATQSDLYNVDTNAGGATANDEITTSEITIIAGEGNVTIANAAGKKVVVSNILGQIVATQVLTSDNAVIAAPQGVVVVAVEGEEAVKAIVK